MSELKRTQLYEAHLAAGGQMVDFGGWEMPIQYPIGIVQEHLYSRRCCGLFDVSHMGRLLIEGPERVKFLQHVLSSNVATLERNRAQYCIIPNENGGAIDDAYLYKFQEDRLLLVVNASNTEKDKEHLFAVAKDFDVEITDVTGAWAALAVQGPRSDRILSLLTGCDQVTAPKRNSLNTILVDGRPVRISKTGYTGEPMSYEIYVNIEDASWLWNRLIELNAKPTGLGARDTLRLEAGLPLYGHEMGDAPDGSELPMFACSLSRFAVSFAAEKGDFIGRKALEKQFEALQRIQGGDYTESDMAALPKRIVPIAMIDRGVIRAGMPVYQGEQQIGWITSGTMIPYFSEAAEGQPLTDLNKTGKRSIGFAYVNSDIRRGDVIEVDVRGKRLKAAVVLRHLNATHPQFSYPEVYQHVEK